MGGVRFFKYEGLGNDFILVDLRRDGGDLARLLSGEAAEQAARILCDRRFGIGGDGVLPILPAGMAGADARMRVLNSDGSEAEMCGNGIRCVAKHLYDGDPSLRRRAIRIETMAGVLDCDVQAGADGTAATVAVEMGRPRLAPEEVPVDLESASGRIVAEPLDVAGRRMSFTAVSMGNPHAVMFLADDEALMETARKIGPEVEGHPLFPRRTNVELAHARNGGARIDLVVFERGCGITLACGTGACATAVAAVLEGRAREDREIAINLPGGTMHVLVHPGLAGVRMRGPATRVFDGALDLGSLLDRRAPAALGEGPARE